MLPAAASIKEQGANKGATTAFLISTPESGIDSIAVSYALLDPILTIARPIAAFLSAMVAGVAENLLHPEPQQSQKILLPMFGGGETVKVEEEKPNEASFFKKIQQGLDYAVNELWADLAGWFLLGIILAGIISALIPQELIEQHLGHGLKAMLIMLIAGTPVYMCATASTPIAAALILKGVSPGAALVFLLTGPATNVTSLSVLYGILGKKTTALYLISIALVSLACGLALDFFYLQMGISAQAVVGQAAEVAPRWLQFICALALILLSIPPLIKKFIKKRSSPPPKHADCNCPNGSCK